MATMEIYVNYGCLVDEKRKVYTYGAPAETAVCSDKLIVKLPDDWILCENRYGETILESPWGWYYTPNEILAGNENPMFCVYDINMKDHKIKLEIVESQEREESMSDLTRTQQIVILMADGCTRLDAIKHLDKGTIIIDRHDFIMNFESYCEEWSVDREEKDGLLNMLLTGESPDTEFWGIVRTEDNTYYIMYVL